MKCEKCGYLNKGVDTVCANCNASLNFLDIDIGDMSIVGEVDEKSKKNSSNKYLYIALVLALVVIAGAAYFVPQQLAKARAADILQTITAARTGVEAYVRKHRVWPASEDDLQPGHVGLMTDMELVVSKGVIKLSIAEESGKTATISPSVQKGRVVWKCQNGGIGQKYLPLGCFR